MKILQRTPTEFVIQQGRNFRQECLTILLLLVCCGLPSIFVSWFLVEQIQDILVSPTSANLSCQRTGGRELDCVLVESKLIGNSVVRKIADRDRKIVESKAILANSKLASEERDYQVLLRMSSEEIVLPQPSSSKIAQETAQQINQFLKTATSTELTIQQDFTWLDFSRDFGSWMGVAFILATFLLLHSLYSLFAFILSFYRKPWLETYGFDREGGVFTVEYKSWLNPSNIQLPLLMILDVDLEGDEEESKLLFILASGKNLSTVYPIKRSDRTASSSEIDAQETANQIRRFLNLEEEVVPELAPDMIDRENN